MSQQVIPAVLGLIEPHSQLLTLPPDGQSLYKIMSVDNLLRSVAGSYLHFNRVDSYTDSPFADPNDGQQLPKDKPLNVKSTFVKAPSFSVADYYDQSRTRTYACCFSLENSDYIWNHYAMHSDKGKICVIFDFAKLRATLNQTLAPGNAALVYKGIQCHQIFNVNYGLVQYVDWDRHQANEVRLQNPIMYTYLKGKKFEEDRELRMSLAAPGFVRIRLGDGSEMEFPPTMQVAFAFGAAIGSGVIKQLLFAPECDTAAVFAELGKLGIGPLEGSDLPRAVS